MTTIMAHIIGMDEAHKAKLISKLSHVHFLDLDNIQQSIHNNKDITQKKLEWGSVSNEINIKYKQLRTLQAHGKSSTNTQLQVKRLQSKRKLINKEIHNKWIELMNGEINDRLNAFSIANGGSNESNGSMNESTNEPSAQPIISLGYNVFPKDYRIKVNIPTDNKIIFDINSQTWARNQINFYIDTYRDRIANGKFPTTLLDHCHLINKHEKLLSMYESRGYEFVPKNNLLEHLDTLSKEMTRLGDGYAYVAIPYKAGDVIPVNVGKPIQGFLTKTEATNHLKSKLKTMMPIYLYKVKREQFEATNGKLIAHLELHPVEEKCLMPTI